VLRISQNDCGAEQLTETATHFVVNLGKPNARLITHECRAAVRLLWRERDTAAFATGMGLTGWSDRTGEQGQPVARQLG